MRVELSDLFTSRAKTAALLVLAAFREPICLNELAELAGCSLCATDAAVKHLRRQKLVVRGKRRNETVFSLNRSRAEATLIENLRLEDQRQRTARKAEQMGERARSALQFADSTSEFLKRVRKRNEPD